MTQQAVKADEKRKTGKAEKRGKAKASSKRTSAKRESRFPDLFGAPARIMGPRLLFIASVVLLCVLGLVMVYSASSITAFDEYGNASYYFDRQAMFLAAGVVVCVVMALVPYRFWGRPVVFIVLWVIACAMLALTAFGGGVSALGAERSILIAGFNLQPSEFAKIAVLVTIASLISLLKDGVLSFRRAVVFIIFAALVPILLIYRQPDLGTAIILVVGILSLMVLSGFSWKPIFVIIGVFVGYVAFVCIIQPYHIDRIVAMFDPWLDPEHDGYQSIQSLYAFGSGGLFGTGLGLSRQKYLYLPEAHTDFIFAIIGEELGLVGTLCTVALFGLFIFSGIRICRTAPDLLGCMFSGGMTVMVGFQACVNMAQSCGIAPVTGKALPFVSYGGSSLVATLLMVGIILSVSRCSKVGAANERRRDNLMVLDGAKGAAPASAPAPAKGRVVSMFGKVGGSVSGKARASGRERDGGPSRAGAADGRDRRGTGTRGAAAGQDGNGRTARSRSGSSAGAPERTGRLDYLAERSSREYASREHRVRSRSPREEDGASRRRRPSAPSDDARPRAGRGPSTKPANPSGTRRHRY